MFALVRRLLVLCLILAPLSAFAFSEWQQPTPEELSMKSYAADPDAPAVYLYREETVNDNIHIHTLYARVKILTEKGKEMFGDIESPAFGPGYTIRGITGRTIQPNGTTVPFTGKPYDKLLVKSGNVRVMEKVFSMPDVQVGSILEYRWVLGYDDGIVSHPDWQIQQDIPVVKAHYHFVPSNYMNGGSTYITTRENGHENVANILLYSYILPSGVKVRQGQDGYDLVVENIPALPKGDYLPPFRSLADRLTFYYSPFRTPAEYWKTEGKYWSKAFDHFADPSGKIRAAVNTIIAPGDSDEQKVEKIYAAVMKLDNTSYSRQHSAAENKAEHVKINNAEDVWEQKRGYDDQITRLFVAMVRAAGLKVYGAIVVDRDRSVFVTDFLNWNQLDDELAIVELNGKEVYFDPGQRYCEFGKLAWKHTWASGLRESDKGVVMFTTPAPSYKDNSTNRVARLSLSATDQVSGTLYDNMSGAQALYWRQAVLRGDEDSVKKQFDNTLQNSMPPGVHVKVDHFVGLTDYTHPLMVVVQVSGTLGTATGKHLFIPAAFFEAGNPPLFAKTNRIYPIDMNYPYMISDDFQLTLPENMTVESLPKGGDIPFVPNADYLVKFVSTPHLYGYARLLRVASVLYKATQYPSLRDFYQKLSSSDQSQAALQITPVSVSASVAAPATPATGK
ncbi:MAG: transglutaminase domain-containing protein [Acidobacteriaceae bacterium]